MAGLIKFDRREIVALAALLAILLFLPLLVSHLAVAQWGELSWRRPLEVAFLEWTGAFLQAFLCLLLVAGCRHSGNWRHAWLATAFLGLSGMNFAYALSGPGTETASWLRLLGVTLGGAYACGAWFSRHEEAPGAARVLVRMVLPLIFVLAVLIWIPFGLRQLLPALIVPASRQMTLFGRLAAVIPAGLLFLAALPWLRLYLRTWQRDGLLFAVVLLMFAQSILVWRVARVFGVLWWGAHLGMLLATLLAAISLLATSIRHSVVWKLLFSLALTFGLTVILTAGLLQGHAQRQFAETVYRQVHARHQLLLAEHAAEIKAAAQSLERLDQLATEQLDLRHGGLPESGTPAWLVSMVETDTAAWRAQFPVSGYMTSQGTLLPPTAAAPPALVVGLLEEIRQELDKMPDGRLLWSQIRTDRQTRQALALVAKPMVARDHMAGFFFKAVEVGWLAEAGLTAGRRLDRDHEGRILFEARRGQELARVLPIAWEPPDEVRPAGELAGIIRQLLAAVYALGPDGRLLLVSVRGRPYLLSACQVPGADWIAVHLLDIRVLPGEGGGLTYAFVAVGMVVLLIGFVVLLLLLNVQLARPLQQLLQATERVECGDLATRIASRDDTELGVVSASFDHMLERMGFAYGELERTVAERTAALREVQQANQAKATFFASVSHELRTPLHGILSCSRLGIELTDTALPKAQEYFTNISLSGRRLLKLIDEILDLAKLESGFMEFNRQPVNLLALARQAGGELAGLFAEKGIRLVCPAPDDDVKVVADLDMMRRVFINLFGNAAKFARAGTVVTVEFRRDRDSITAAVLDEGPGIPEGETEKVFEKFFQGRRGQSPGGTGIGLATCREIVTAHGGTIRAGNRPGGGAEFIFTLPLATSTGMTTSEAKDN